VPPAAFRPASAAGRASTAGAAAAAGTVLVRYVGKSRAMVLGAVTRRYYAFVPGGAVQSVDARDAAVLLRSVGFQRA
jgi:hypothetical protein